MRRVAYLTESFGDGSKGGGSLSSLDFVLLLKEHYDIIDVYHIGKCNLILDNVHFIRIKRPILNKIQSIRDVLKVIFFWFSEFRCVKPNIHSGYRHIFVNSWPTVFSDYNVKAEKLNCTIIIRGSCNFFQFLQDGLSFEERQNVDRSNFSYFANIIFVSNNISESWIKYLNFIGNTYYLPNTVDNSFSTRLVEKSYKKFNKNDINVLLVGSVQSRKNQDVIHYSATKFLDGGKNIFFHIVGTISKTHGGNEIYEKLCKLRNVKFYGHRVDVFEFIEDADVCLLTSKAEALPRSLLEYIKLGKLVVSSNVDGNSEIILDRHNGFLFDPCNPEELYDILDYVTQNLYELDYMKRNAVRHYETNFSVFAQKSVFGEIIGEIDI
jgi:glycosyltransferase involved in cell wall biosynthesis